MKYVLICKNKECSACGFVLEAGEYVVKYDKERKQMVPNFKGASMVCSNCGEELQFYEKDGVIPDFSVNGFKGLPDDKKKEVLRQRFDKEIKTNGKDEKEQRKRTAIGKMIGYDGK